MNRTVTRAALAALAAALAAAAPAVEVDGIAARVGTEAILKSDVAMELARLRLPASRYDDVRAELIDRKLILRAASEAKMTLQDWMVENRIREIIDRSFGGDRNQLIETLAKQKVSYPEWHSRMREDMIIQAMRWNVVDKNATASPAAMREEFNSNPGKYSTPPKVTVSVILLKPEDAEKRDEISAALATESFADIARRYSADSHAAEGGVWKDVVPADVFKKEICDEIAKMPKGTISHWIELDGWSFLLRKDDETPGRARTFAEAYADVEENVRQAVALKAYRDWIERLRAETYIKVF